MGSIMQPYIFTHSHSLPSSSRGFTLVEIMIALVLGLFLLTGLYTVLGSNQLTYSAVNSSIRITDNGRQLLTLLRNQIQQAGFKNLATIKSQSEFPSDQSGSYATAKFAAGQFISGIENFPVSETNRATGSDEIRLRFFGAAASSAVPAVADNTIFDCLGQGVSESNANPITLSIFVSRANDLICRDSLNNNDVIMAQNVESLQFRYMPLNGSFFRADEMTAAQWLTLNRVEFGLLISEPTSQGVVSGVTTSYQLLDTTQTKSNDRLRQVFSQMVYIRNKG